MAVPPAHAEAAAPTLTFDRRGLLLTGAEPAFTLRLRPRAQIDVRWFPGVEGSEEMLLRRIRPVLEGTAGPLSWRLMPELANTNKLLDAWAEVDLGNDIFLRAGKLKGVVGTERRQSFTRTLFLERGLPSVLTPTREVGIEGGQRIGGGRLAWTAGLYHGSPDDADRNGNDDGGTLDGALGLEAQVSAGLTLGLAGTWGRERFTIDNADEDNRLRYRTSGRATFLRYADGVEIDGAHWRLNPSLRWYRGPWSVFAEYLESSYTVRRDGPTRAIHTQAWTVQIGWIATGEAAAFKGFKPAHAFEPRRGHWGAFEVGARLHGLTGDDAAFASGNGPRLASASSTQSALATGLALNWHLSAHLMFGLNLERTHFGGKGAPRRDEDLVLTRLQIDY